MGGKNSKDQNNDPSNPDQKRQEISIDHPRFKNVKLEGTDPNEVMVCTVGVDQKQYKAWATKLQTAKLDPSRLLLPISQQYTSKGFCGSLGNLKLGFHPAPFLLSEQISKRKPIKNFFLETELWYLLYNLISAKIQMKAAGYNVGDIQPKNLFLTSAGALLILNSLSFPGQKSNFMKSLEGQETYLAPEDVKALENSSYNDTQSPSSQMFAIGATVLSNGILEDITSLYDVKHFKFNEAQFNQYVLSWCRNSMYSEILRGMIWNLCSIDPNNRLTPDELWKMLQKHQDSISRQVSFSIDNAPEKIHKQMGRLRQVLSRPPESSKSIIA